MAYCGDQCLVNYESESTRLVKKLLCRSWTCPDCQPKRRRELIARAMSGKPKTFITLTCRRLTGKTPEQAARDLSRAWSILRKRIARGKPQKDEYKARCARARAAGRSIPAKPEGWPFAPGSKPLKIEYATIVEATEAGWPHLHILTRHLWIDQAWLSAEMDAILGSPVVWIERIENRGRAVAYVSKYAGKATHKFGTCKRYYFTTDYQLPDDREGAPAPYVPKRWERQSEGLRWWLNAARLYGWRTERVSEGQVRFFMRQDE